jgi:hypothetical protein
MTAAILTSMREGDAIAWFPEEHQRGLVSLWSMRTLDLSGLISAIRNVEITASLIDVGDPSHVSAAKANHDESLGRLLLLCQSLEFSISAIKIQKTLDLLRLNLNRTTRGVFERASAVIASTIEEEASARAYYVLAPGKSEYYAVRDPLGEAVSLAFPSTKFDAMEASRCYALGRNTACVFHLMRVLEWGLSALATAFKVEFKHRNWEQVIHDIELAIGDPNQLKALGGDWKDDREFYSQCISYLRIVKDAWRNYTAHARGKYDEQEAFELMGGVRGFMQKLSCRLAEALPE